MRLAPDSVELPTLQLLLNLLAQEYITPPEHLVLYINPAPVGAF